jgi:hypothetical protein
LGGDQRSRAAGQEELQAAAQEGGSQVGFLERVIMLQELTQPVRLFAAGQVRDVGGYQDEMAGEQ